MSKRRKWDNFSIEEQKEIIETSKSFSEVEVKFGYSKGTHHRQEIIELAKLINADINHLLRRRSSRFHDLTNQTFGHLTALHVDDEKTKKTRMTHWWCKCDCGNPNLVLTSARSLLTGGSISCGCSLIEDLKGQLFGYLEPIQIDWEKTGKGNRAFWLCKCHACNSNELHSVRAQALKDGYTKTCGCSKKSFGEKRIEEILKELNISFIPEYTYPDLKDKIKLRFDFHFLYNNKEINIECQGAQHYQSIDTWGGEKRFLIQQKHDEQKRQYCKENGIALIEIPYSDYNKLDTQYLLNKLNEVIK